MLKKQDIRKIIWSVYTIIWIYFIFFDNSYGQEDHIFLYLVLGWIPFLILHKIWKTEIENMSIDELIKKGQKYIPHDLRTKIMDGTFDKLSNIEKKEFIHDFLKRVPANIKQRLVDIDFEENPEPYLKIMQQSKLEEKNQLLSKRKII